MSGHQEKGGNEKMPEPKVIELASGLKVCSEHGGLIATVGQWTGRRMIECPVCGAYEVVEES